MVGPEIANRMIVYLVANLVAAITAVLIPLLTIFDPVRSVLGKAPIAGAWPFANARALADTRSLTHTGSLADTRPFPGTGTSACNCSRTGSRACSRSA